MRLSLPCSSKGAGSLEARSLLVASVGLVALLVLPEEVAKSSRSGFYTVVPGGMVA